MVSARVQRRASLWVLAFCGGYLALAYFAAPEFWSYRVLHDDMKPGVFLTTTTQGIPGDPINIGLIGTEEELSGAMRAAGWSRADPLSLKADIEIGESVLFDRPDPDAPVSTLLFGGRPQDFAFERDVGKSADARHHVRFWLTFDLTDDSRPTWFGAATFDRGVGVSHDTGQFTHHIAPDIDADRDLIIADLKAAGAIASVKEIDGIGATKHGRNGGGDPYFTDGKIALGVLSPGK
ncbi:LssY C-terminal domain-containing protein [Aminobacter sp. HY435]|uniref:LssY C-terminal domain-containing protein n=1 Tax=Aminobacter sp. HY435 TaxID=2970917 RepID=UPI0022B9A57F|nr:LssY C-terminal domain-containing protein [Aminobacter sp. HY435]